MNAATSRELVSVMLWDVRWEGDGFGKHGNGPFATRRQAQACLRAVGWSGTVELIPCKVELREYVRIVGKGLRR